MAPNFLILATPFTEDPLLGRVWWTRSSVILFQPHFRPPFHKRSLEIGSFDENLISLRKFCFANTSSLGKRGVFPISHSGKGQAWVSLFGEKERRILSWMCQFDVKQFLSLKISRTFCQFATKNSCWSQSFYCTKNYLELPSVLFPKGQDFCEERREFKLFLLVNQEDEEKSSIWPAKENSMMLKSHKWIDIDHSYVTFLKTILLAVRQWKYPER